jgi:hypothetical protein
MDILQDDGLEGYWHATPHWGILGALYIFFFTSDYSTEDGISG